MILKDFHPHFLKDIDAIGAHILSITEDPRAALKRVYEFEALIAKITSTPDSGTRLSGRLQGCLVRHGGRDLKIRIVFRYDASERCVRFLLASYGGQNWSALAKDRL